jgi:nucleoid DNA-binding protein
MLIKSKTLIPNVAKKLNLSEELVEDVVYYYYKNIRTKIESFGAERIRITGLGVLHIRKEKVEISIIKLTSALKTDKIKSFKHEIKRKKLEQALEEQKLLISKLTKNESISNLEKQK